MLTYYPSIILVTKRSHLSEFLHLVFVVSPCLTIWAILDSLRHFIPQDKLTLIPFTDKTFNDPLPARQVNEVVDSFDLVWSVLFCLGYWSSQEKYPSPV